MFMDDIVTLLVAANVGVSGGANGTIFRSSKANIPSGVGPYLSIIATGGTGPRLVHNSVGYRQPGAQIMARASTLQACETMINAAYLALVGPKGRKVNFTVNGTWYISLEARQEPFDMGLDEAARIRYAFNVECVKRP